jgi:hypothetical protein
MITERERLTWNFITLDLPCEGDIWVMSVSDWLGDWLSISQHSQSLTSTLYDDDLPGYFDELLFCHFFSPQGVFLYLNIGIFPSHSWKQFILTFCTWTCTCCVSWWLDKFLHVSTWRKPLPVTITLKYLFSLKKKKNRPEVVMDWCVATLLLSSWWFLLSLRWKKEMHFRFLILPETSSHHLHTHRVRRYGKVWQIKHIRTTYVTFLL